MNQKLRHFNRYLLNGNTDIWARELLNGWFDYDDSSYPDMTEREFINNYIRNL